METSQLTWNVGKGNVIIKTRGNPRGVCRVGVEEVVSAFKASQPEPKLLESE